MSCTCWTHAAASLGDAHLLNLTHTSKKEPLSHRKEQSAPATSSACPPGSFPPSHVPKSTRAARPSSATTLSSASPRAPTTARPASAARPAAIQPCSPRDYAEPPAWARQSWGHSKVAPSPRRRAPYLLRPEYAAAAGSPSVPLDYAEAASAATLPLPPPRVHHPRSPLCLRVGSKALPDVTVREFVSQLLVAGEGATPFVSTPCVSPSKHLLSVMEVRARPGLACVTPSVWARDPNPCHPARASKRP